jgi:hypothetical protein
MTEEEWLASSDLKVLLDSVRGKASDRKLRLFAAVCYRQALKRCQASNEWWKRYLEGVIAIVEAFESYVDGKTLYTELFQVYSEAGGDRCHELFAPDAWTAARRCAFGVNGMHYGSGGSEHDVAAKCEALRHIIRNPFRTFDTPTYLPSEVIHLAEAMYTGQDCHHYALCDALLDAGHEELAEHFREPGHPKGCWALDVILGKS